MKAVSIKQPWASLIVQGIKGIENRTWPTKFRGTVYVHASLKPARFEFEMPGQATAQEIQISSALNEAEEEELFGCIIGQVDIVDCVINHPSQWAEKGTVNGKQIYNWVLANPVQYKNPIWNVKGKLSFWEPDITLQICEGCQEPENIDNMITNEEAQWFCTDCVTGYQQESENWKCRVCGCTNNDCGQCVEKTGHPCHWVEENLCSACEGEDE
ncbi:ASCH domain-containing protein [Flavobacterium sp. 25HG05S-40]|uniref:ASCH domain-containing protein n=1 Tax=Flavobacterium sp. 25HG05S-40 TaxID=3458682 RepID=UPI004043FB46